MPGGANGIRTRGQGRRWLTGCGLVNQGLTRLFVAQLAVSRGGHEWAIASEFGVLYCPYVARLQALASAGDDVSYQGAAELRAPAPRDSGRWEAAYVGPDARLYRAPSTFEAKDDAIA